jgi:outer membrane protein OmpA-like peptidoglycan-associated protein
MNERSGKPDLGISFMGTAETGVKWDIGVGTALYTSVFVDYGFNDMLKSSYSEKHFMEYNQNEPSKPIVNTACVLPGRFSPVSFGVKLKLAFSVGCRDLLNDRRAYKSMLPLQYDDYYDFMPETQTTETQPQSIDMEQPAPEAVPEDTVQTDAGMEIPGKVQQSEVDTAVISVEREAYLEAAKARRQQYSRSMNVSGIRNMGNYSRGTVTLTAGQEATLDDYIEVLTENPQAHIEITGHTCDLGTDELNLRIGRERADLAKDYLLGKGIAPSRISTFSKGETEPLFPNDNELSRSKNRRLGIRLKEIGSPAKP